MELRDYIEQGAKKAGSLTELGKMLDMSQPTISGAKAHKRPLTAMAVMKLAHFINADIEALIAANELVTEKDEKKRAYWRPFVEHAKAASIALTLSLVTNFVTPSPAEASQVNEVYGDTLYYVKSWMEKLRKKAQLFRTVLVFIKGMLKPQPAMLARCIA